MQVYFWVNLYETSTLVFLSSLFPPHLPRYQEEESPQYQAAGEHKDLLQFQKLQTNKEELPQEKFPTLSSTCPPLVPEPHPPWPWCCRPPQLWPWWRWGRGGQNTCSLHWMLRLLTWPQPIRGGKAGIHCRNVGNFPHFFFFEGFPYYISEVYIILRNS